MNNLKLLIPIIAFICFISCKKEDQSTNDNYSSIDDFFARNQVSLHIYFIDNSVGGSFTTTQGTIVNIPSKAFVTQSGLPFTGNVAINFKDIYKKSDMLLSNLHTMTDDRKPLKSGGEFFIDAFYNNSKVVLAFEKKITITQPASLTGGIDTINKMKPFVLQNTDFGLLWVNPNFDSTYFTVATQASNYIFSMYEFSIQSDTGTWCNSDNASYFDKYQQTMLTLHPTDTISNFNTQVFLLFNDLTSMVHVYQNFPDFKYYYAPVGLKCTLVAIGVRNGYLFSSFVPITINPDQVVNFTLGKTTTDAFKSQLKALN